MIHAYGSIERSSASLSDSTIRQTYTVLRAGLDGAVRDGLLARNPAALVKRPGVERTEALRWDRVDLDAGKLKVAATIAWVNHALTITDPIVCRKWQINQNQNLSKS